MKAEIALDERLCVIAGMIRRGKVMADIGTDHGYLPCALVLEGICPRAYAADIGEKPLKSAQDTIEAYGLSERVEARLSDGLSAFSGEEMEDIVIAGMGGELIGEILGACPWVRSEKYRLILQPMTRPEHLRRWLWREGFEICEEKAVVSGRFAYTVMQAEFIGISREISPLVAWTGKIWDNSDSASLAYLRRIQSRLEDIAGGMEHTKHPEAADYHHLLEQIKGRTQKDV